MPISEFVELLGAPILFGIVLLAFWEGDGLLSDDALADISRWLRRIGPPPPNDTVGVSVKAIFEKIFGTRQLSLRCVLVSAITSTAGFLVVFAVAVLVIDTATLDGTEGAVRELEPWGLLTASFEELFAAWAFLIVVFVINIGGDYLSLGVTRYFLNRLARSDLRRSLAIAFDFVGSFVAFNAWFFIVFTVGEIVVEGSANPINSAETMLGVWTTLFVPIEADSLSVISQAMRALIFTTFISSIWLWGAALGTDLIRLLARSGPVISALQYVLPVDRTPVRTIGILGFLVLSLISVTIEVAGAAVSLF